MFFKGGIDWFYFIDIRTFKARQGSETALIKYTKIAESILLTIFPLFTSMLKSGNKPSNQDNCKI